MSLRRWKVWVLDAWGNPENGYMVNDRRERGYVTFDDDGTEDQAVLDALAEAGIVTKDCRANVDVHVSEFEWEPGGYCAINIDRFSDDEPLMMLETCDD